ncbi:pheromone receptor [Moniliophthora roreri]|nr:pheromone receptor [Moniliophthora roreri]
MRNHIPQSHQSDAHREVGCHTFPCHSASVSVLLYSTWSSTIGIIPGVYGRLRLEPLLEAPHITLCQRTRCYEIAPTAEDARPEYYFWVCQCSVIYRLRFQSRNVCLTGSSGAAIEASFKKLRPSSRPVLSGLVVQRHLAITSGIAYIFLIARLAGQSTLPCSHWAGITFTSTTFRRPTYRDQHMSTRKSSAKRQMLGGFMASDSGNNPARPGRPKSFLWFD